MMDKEIGPWTNVYGLVRSSLAFGTLLTLLVDDSDTLFRPLGVTATQGTHSWQHRLNFFWFWGENLEAARWAAALVLLVVLVGYRPRITGFFHWWISASFAMSCVPAMGGDHVAVVLSLTLLPVALTDSRRWHWTLPSPEIARSLLAERVAVASIAVARLQVSVIYLWAGVAKLRVAEWTNGTALYYWALDPKIGLPVRWHIMAEPWLADPLVVSFLTWSPIVLELALFAAISGSWRSNRWLLLAGILFHFANILVFGLVSFFFSMLGALIVLLRPAYYPFSIPQFLASKARKSVSCLAMSLKHRFDGRRDGHAT